MDAPTAAFGEVASATGSATVRVCAGSTRNRRRSRASAGIMYIRCRDRGSTSAGSPNTIVNT
jgi:hypothetical protein